MPRFTPPPPRPAVADPALTRPDWTRGEYRDRSMLWLDKNENPDPELAAVVGAVMRSLPDEAYSTYPELGPLYRKLAGPLGVGAENLIFTAGSDGAIRAVFEAFVSPGDKVLHTLPTFAMYAVYARMYGADATGVEYRRDARGPALDAAEVVAAIRRHRPKVFCLPNPDSPTGTVFNDADLRAIVEAAGEVGALALIDEAYNPFHTGTILPAVNDYGHLVVCRSTGKAWGFAGLRIGYAAAAPEVTRLLHKVRPMYEVNTVAVHAFERLLDHADAMAASVARLQAGKDAFIAAMTELGFPTVRCGGNFLHVAFGETAPAIHAALADLVYYRKDFNEPCLKGFSRFSAAPPAVFQPVIDRIRAAARA